MKRTLRLTVIAPIFGVLLVSQALVAAGVPGAIFTTNANGTIVNANVQYVSKCDVYLDGGPGPNAPAGAAGLPAGDYYFQVTDPSGQTLLSTDPVANRRMQVNAKGVISAYTGSGVLPHPTGIDTDHRELGAITIGLANSSCPTDYLDSPNAGGVYKVWVTPVGSFLGDATKVDNPCGGGCSHGFVSSKSKTDNFKVVPTVANFCLTVRKEWIDDQRQTSPGIGWWIHVTDPSGHTNDYSTGLDGTFPPLCSLVPGPYTVSEDVLPPAVNAIGLRVNGTVVLPPQSIYSFVWTARSPVAFEVVFQNPLPLF